MIGIGIISYSLLKIYFNSVKYFIKKKYIFKKKFIIHGWAFSCAIVVLPNKSLLVKRLFLIIIMRQRVYKLVCEGR